MKRSRILKGVAALSAGVLLLSACGGNGSSTETTGGNESTGGPAAETSITWWHNSNSDPGKAFYEEVVAEFEEANPGVTVTVEALQHEDMLTKLEAAFQSGDMPDIFMERGGGEMADHVAADLLKDLTEPAAETIEKIGGSVAGWQQEGRTYGLPFSVGVVGFWYNKALFADAGIDAPPATMAEFDVAVQKLKDAGIHPVSVGAGDGWPAAHYWYYFGLRQCSQDVLNNAVLTHDFSDNCWIRAGESLAELVGTEPFNPGFLTTPAQSGPTSASGLLATGNVAMELAGHWEPGVMQGLTEDNLGLGEDTGWFPFPAVEGGEGDQSAALGGGDAWAVAKNAPDAAVDFAQYLLSDDVQKRFAELDMGLPTNSSASQYVSDPSLATLLEVRDEAPYVQLYFDTAFGASIGGAMNDAIVRIFGSAGDAQGVVDAITEAAAVN